MAGAIDLDKRCFGPRRVRGQPGRGPYGKPIVFGLVKRGGQGDPKITPDCPKKTLQAIIRGEIGVLAVVITDGPRGYEGPVDARTSTAFFRSIAEAHPPAVHGRASRPHPREPGFGSAIAPKTPIVCSLNCLVNRFLVDFAA